MQTNNERTFPLVVAEYIGEKKAMGIKFDKATMTLKRICILQQKTDKGEPVFQGII
jgi:hypothetical protein